MLLHLLSLFFISINAAPLLNQKLILSKDESLNKSSINANISSLIGNIEVPKDFDLIKVAKDLKKFGIDHLKDDHHIEGLPLDRQGKVNPDFHKEIFLGNHELFESEFQRNPQRREKKLGEIFNEADLDHDERVSHDELLNYVFKNIQQHAEEAKEKNSRLFVLIDSNKNGKITWHEYAALYVKFHHMNESDIRDFNDVDFIRETFDRDLQQELLKIRFRWIDTDGGNDNELDIDEFLAFRHPEIASRTYKYVVDDIITQMDQDNDIKIKETEFVDGSLLEDNGDKEWAKTGQLWSQIQRTEFQEMDEDHDGYLTRDELLNAYNPLNRAHINIQIKKLFSKVDVEPKDNFLSLEEIENHADVFADMRILDSMSAIHEEM